MYPTRGHAGPWRRMAFCMDKVASSGAESSNSSFKAIIGEMGRTIVSLIAASLNYERRRVDDEVRCAASTALKQASAELTAFPPVTALRSRKGYSIPLSMRLAGQYRLSIDGYQVVS